MLCSNKPSTQDNITHNIQFPTEPSCHKEKFSVRLEYEQLWPWNPFQLVCPCTHACYLEAFTSANASMKHIAVSSTNKTFNREAISQMGSSWSWYYLLPSPIQVPKGYSLFRCKPILMLKSPSCRRTV